ncbi:putative Protein kinase domain superfamily protein [Paratrimastix pyriformis]|uniref:Protein kinase domain-containing protein n=1 Tax=Paratrimastix pyriformis TaxID=342808 RepID=A0ABQ8UME0_9EUKA|nr:putative Protein kinase domain superfamily protein [Paratrimastix pyriformis]
MLLLGLLFCLPFVFGDSPRYVSQEGNDQNPCTAQSPCRTIDFSHSPTYVLGTYEVSYFVKPLQNDFRLVGMPGSALVCTSQYGFTIEGLQANLTFENLTIHACDVALSLHASPLATVTLTGCTFSQMDNAIIVQEETIPLLVADNCTFEEVKNMLWISASQAVYIRGCRFLRSLCPRYGIFFREPNYILIEDTLFADIQADRFLSVGTQAVLEIRRVAFRNVSGTGDGAVVEVPLMVGSTWEDVAFEGCAAPQNVVSSDRMVNFIARRVVLRECLGRFYVGSLEGGLFEGWVATDNGPDNGVLALSLVEDLTLTNGTFLRNSAVTSGAALVMEHGDQVTVTDSIFAGNTASQGGAVFFNGISFVFRRVHFENNTALWGGAYASLVSSGSALFEDVAFTRNRALSVGGALSFGATGNLTLSRCQFVENAALQNAGAMRVRTAATLELRDVIFTRNTASQARRPSVPLPPLSLHPATWPCSSACPVCPDIFHSPPHHQSGGLETEWAQNLRLDRVVAQGNMAEDGAFWSVLRLEDGLVTRSTFRGHAAGAGGLIYLRTFIRLRIVDSLVEDVTASKTGVSLLVADAGKEVLFKRTTFRRLGGAYGVLLSAGSFTLRDCRFEECPATTLLYMVKVPSLQLNGTTFWANGGQVLAGHDIVQADIAQCSFLDNHAGPASPVVAMQFENAQQVRVTNCTFRRNWSAIPPFSVASARGVGDALIASGSQSDSVAQPAVCDVTADDVAFADCTFLDNQCGALASDLRLRPRARAAVTDCIFTNSSVPAVFIQGTATGAAVSVARSRFSNFARPEATRAEGAVDNLGGGLTIAGNHQGRVEECHFEGCWGDTGGLFFGLDTLDLVHLDAGALTVTGCRFVGNEGSNGGAASAIFAAIKIFLDGGMVELTDCLLAGNTANESHWFGYGGGALTMVRDLEVPSGLTLRRCTVIDSLGGGIMLTGNFTATLSECTMARNTYSGPLFPGNVLALGETSVKVIDCALSGSDVRPYSGWVLCAEKTSLVSTGCDLPAPRATLQVPSAMWGTVPQLTMVADADCIVYPLCLFTYAGPDGGLLSRKTEAFLLDASAALFLCPFILYDVSDFGGASCSDPQEFVFYPVGPMVAGISAGASVALLAGILALVCFQVAKRKRRILNEKLSAFRAENITSQEFAGLEVVKKIGEGASGEVFLGRLHGTSVAIKRLHAASILRPEEIATFRREIALLRPIVLFLGAEFDGPVPMLVTEYLPQGTLFTLLHETKVKLSFPARIEMALQACRGMTYLHSLQTPLIHGDLKTLNLLLDGVGQVRIADFGLARLKTDRSAVFQGTPAYLAPEIIAGGALSTQSDVYAFVPFVLALPPLFDLFLSSL